MKPNFTSAGIDTATKVMALMAMKQTIAEKYTNLQSQVLEQLKLEPSEARVEKLRGRGVEIPPYCTKEEHLYLLEMGTDKEGNCLPHLPIAKYYSEMDRRAKDIGFINGVNAVAQVDHELRLAKVSLFQHTQNLEGMPNLEWDKLTASPKFYDSYFELTLKLYAPLVKVNQNLKLIEKEVFKSHIQPSFVTN
jgi:hypothetical protein